MNWVTFRLFPGRTVVIMLLVMICSIYSFPDRERQLVAKSYQMAIRKINKRFVNAIWFLGFPSCTMNLIGIQRRLQSGRAIINYFEAVYGNTNNLVCTLSTITSVSKSAPK